MNEEQSVVSFKKAVTNCIISIVIFVAAFIITLISLGIVWLWRFTF